MAAPALKLYTINVNGIEHVVQLSPDDAEAQGAKPYEGKGRPVANKARTPEDKG